MSKNEMPATEAGERVSYELAFHVLPTVAEGEVPAVFEKLKTALTKVGVEITGEEAPARFDLAYEIVKYFEGRNRKFSSAYFGWVRFTALPEQAVEIKEVVDGTKELLRYLLIKLTRLEEAHPFRFHEALATKRVVTIEDTDEIVDDEVVDEVTADVVIEEDGEESK